MLAQVSDHVSEAQAAAAQVQTDEQGQGAADVVAYLVMFGLGSLIHEGQVHILSKEMFGNVNSSLKDRSELMQLEYLKHLKHYVIDVCIAIFK